MSPVIMNVRIFAGLTYTHINIKLLWQQKQSDVTSYVIIFLTFCLSQRKMDLLAPTTLFSYHIKTSSHGSDDVACG